MILVLFVAGWLAALVVLGALVGAYLGQYGSADPRPVSSGPAATRVVVLLGLLAAALGLTIGLVA